MKYLFIILMFASVTAFGQKKPAVVKSKISTQQIKKPLKSKPEIFKNQQTFSWQIVTDQKLLEANIVFKERIQFDFDFDQIVTIEENFKDEPFDFNSTIQPDENGLLDNPTYFSKTLIHKFEIKKDILILTEKETKIVKIFKIIFNKNREVVRLQNLENNRFYDPTSYKGVSKSM